MATVSSTSDQVAGSFEKLSLNTQTKTTNITEPTQQDVYGYYGSHMYQHNYGYNPYGTYPASSFSAMGQDFQQQMLQEYHYPDQGSLSVETGTLANAGGTSGNNGSRARPNFQKTSLNHNSSYQKGGYPARSPSPGFSYESSLAMPWFDPSLSANGRSKHGSSSDFSSYNSNSSSGRNQNLHPYSQYMNGGATSGLSQAYGYMNQIYPNSMNYGHYGNAFGPSSGLGSYGYDSWKKGLGWYPVGNYNKSKSRGYGKENINGLDEMNRGPRVKVYKNQTDIEPAAAVKEQNGSLSVNNKGDNLVVAPNAEQYNKEDFPESYSDARFFVIKSYSEDDVHKSIKYSVWASTVTGNKKLDEAYQEAKEKPNGCPIFLLFSVNTSGQFVGIAEMVGPVDFNKTVEYWQQDKWLGCFPVKWHIVKDVPNSSLRHITLENNDNKPVTNSRDAQEVNLEQGIQILKIFKGHSSNTCILDDFEFYESRQKVMQEKKAKHKPLQKQVLGQPIVADATDNSGKAAIDKEVLEKSVNAAIIEESSVSITAGSVKVNGEIKHLEENGSVAEDAAAKPINVASAC